jgi:hypothetical protein
MVYGIRTLTDATTKSRYGVPSQPGADESDTAVPVPLQPDFVPSGTGHVPLQGSTPSINVSAVPVGK